MDLVGNPKDCFSCVVVHYFYCIANMEGQLTDTIKFKIQTVTAVGFEPRSGHM